MIPAEEPRWAWCFSKGAMPTICFDFYHLCIDNGQKFGIINFAVRSKKNMQWYRRGHNEHDWKSCCRQKRHEGSNPSHCAKTKSVTLMVTLFFLAQLKADTRIDYGQIMVGAIFAVVPIMIVFLALQKYFISGLTGGAVKE